jgi:hypothetical protein
MAHVAAGGGWQTTFTLINSGTSSSQVQLDFFDNNGNTLSLPLTCIQSGAKTTASSITHTIAAGATLVLLTQGSSTVAVTEGSAQLTTNGSTNVNGFAIFRYNPKAQEAVVPLETRNPAAFVLGSIIRVVSPRAWRCRMWRAPALRWAWFFETPQGRSTRRRSIFQLADTHPPCFRGTMQR